MAAVHAQYCMYKTVNWLFVKITEKQPKRSLSLPAIWKSSQEEAIFLSGCTVRVNGYTASRLYEEFELAILSTKVKIYTRN